MIGKNLAKLEEGVAELEFDLLEPLFPLHSSCHALEILEIAETLDSTELLHPPLDMYNKIC